MAFVKDCPTNLPEIIEASTRLSCNKDTYGNNQYICVPNLEKTSLVEFCFDGIMGIHKTNHCIAASGKSLVEVSCLNFSSGCPQEHHWSSDFYKYPACQNISTQHHCYAMDPSCPQNVLVEETDNHDTIDQMSIIVIVILVLLVLPTAGYLIYKIIKKKLAGESSNKSQTNDKKSTESPKEIKRNDKRSADRLSDFISSIFTYKKAKEDSERDCESVLIRKESPKEIKRDDKKTAKSPKKIKRDDKRRAENLRNLQQKKRD